MYSEQKNAELLLNSGKDIGLIVNIGNTKYMKVGRQGGMKENECITVDSNSHEKVKTFKYVYMHI